MKAAERRSRIMQQLNNRRHDTMENLAAEFNVSVRTIQRDIEDLSITEPIYTKVGRHDGGVYVTDGYNFYREYFDERIVTLINSLISNSEKDIPFCLNKEEINLISDFVNKHTKPKRI